MRAALAYLSFRYVTAALPASCSRMYEKEFFGKNINMMIPGSKGLNPNDFGVLTPK